LKKKLKIPKRDEVFQKSIERLPEDWLKDYQDLLCINKINYAFAGQWRPEIFHTQRALLFSLGMAFTNNHKNVHSKDSRIWLKSLFLMFGFFLFPACLDKLAQLLREFFEIDELKEKETNLHEIINKIKGKNKNGNILKILKDLLNNNYVKESRILANAFKHRWSPHYLGIKSKISDYTKIKKDKSGSIIKLEHPIGLAQIPKEKELYNHINILKKANNAFVRCATEIDKIINFNQFYKTKNRIDTLEI